ncbi:ADP-ribosylglycohydrolase family protein, partial [bacterium]|nr:ADP-ribosylglycohydrolase family protein [bacterium]
MRLRYKDYEDKVLGGWIGKSIGGALGARFEGCKAWIDLEINEIIPDELPPNDDLDLQILWLKVLEEKGLALTGDDLGQAWIDGCWYPFNEYGNFRRNFRNGIKPPYTGAHDNEFFETGMG